MVSKGYKPKMIECEICHELIPQNNMKVHLRKHEREMKIKIPGAHTPTLVDKKNKLRKDRQKDLVSDFSKKELSEKYIIRTTKPQPDETVIDYPKPESEIPDKIILYPKNEKPKLPDQINLDQKFQEQKQEIIKIVDTKKHNQDDEWMFL